MGSLADRLRKNGKHLEKWARRRGIGCFRLYDHDIPEFPVIVESYEGRVVAYVSFRRVDEDESLHRIFKEVVASEIESALQPKALLLKDRGIRAGGSRAPGGAEEEAVEAADSAFVVSEGGLRFEVNLQGRHDSGLFLDHRETRAMVRQRAAGKRVLNLFCYTGSFSVYAAAGGAQVVVSVDLSRTYLEWCQRNLALNDLQGVTHYAVQEDVLYWLRLACAFEQRFDLIICDPPTFSNSKRMTETLDTIRNHGEFLGHCRELLAPGGELFFSTNASHFRLDPSLSDFREITEQTRCLDYRRGGGHRCWHFQQPVRT